MIQRLGCLGTCAIALRVSHIFFGILDLGCNRDPIQISQRDCGFGENN
jgi:hypothetical protein